MAHNAQAKKLTGNVALVTGGSRGLGVAIATRLARDGAISAVPSVAHAEAIVRAREG
jgi:3-oxoacyl-[acyl-carrier protein] reductase